MQRSVIILARGVQSSRLGTYGAAWSLTPNLDRLASQSIVLDRFLRTSLSRDTWGTELIASSIPGNWAADRMIGKPSPQGQTITPLPAKTGSPFEKTVANIFGSWKQSGAHWLVLDLSDALPPWNPEIQDLEAYFPTESEIAPEDPDSESEMGEAEGKMEENQKVLTPWLGLLDSPKLNSLHPSRETLLLSHSAAIATLDRKVGTILDLLAENQGEDFHIFLTSDGGIGLGDKNFYGANLETPWLDLVQVPFLWCHPSRISVGLRSQALVSDKDFFDFLNPGKAQIPGVLESCWLQPRFQGRNHVITVGENAAKSVRNGELGLVVEKSGQNHLFHFPLDHWEMNNIASHNPAEVTNLARLFQEDTPEG